jgi:hypothetical protein
VVDVRRRMVLVLVAFAFVCTVNLVTAARCSALGVEKTTEVRQPQTGIYSPGRGEKGGRATVIPDASASVRVLRSASGRRVFEHCRKLDMQALSAESFRLRPFSELGGQDYVILPMRHPRGDRFSALLLFREQDESAVALTVDTTTGELVQVISSEGEEELDSFDKKKWSDCFAVSCSVCIAGCAFTGPLWLKCMAVCCGVSAATCAAVSLQE